MEIIKNTKKCCFLISCKCDYVNRYHSGVCDALWCDNMSCSQWLHTFTVILSAATATCFHLFIYFLVNIFLCSFIFCMQFLISKILLTKKVFCFRKWSLSKHFEWIVCVNRKWIYRCYLGNSTISFSLTFLFHTLTWFQWICRWTAFGCHLIYHGCHLYVGCHLSSCFSRLFLWCYKRF